MQTVNPSKVILGGFVATLVMTMMMFTARMMGLPKMDIAAMLGSMMSGPIPATMSRTWWMGELLHFINGTIVFSLVYAYVFSARFPGSPWLKGVQWGLSLWILAQVLIMPIMGMGFFSAQTPQPMLSLMGSLVGHIIYGAVLAVIAGSPVTRLQWQ